MAQTILLKRRTSDATAPSASDLTTGEVAVNAYSGKLYIKKSDGTVAEVSGSGGGSSSFPAVYNTYKYTATNGQTTFVGNDSSSNLLTYNVGNLIVFLNGVLLVPTTDYVATTGNTVVLQDGATTNDILTIVAFTATIGDGNVAVDTFSGNGSTTAFTLAANPQNENNTQVFIDGIYQSKSNYSVSGTTLTFSTAPPNNTSIEVTTGSREVTQYTATTLSLPNAGMSITGGDLDIPSDSRKIKLGASNDLKIYHDGSNSYIEEIGTGSLKIGSSDLFLQSSDFAETMLNATPNGAVTLYYDNAAKLATASGGVTITGTATATTFIGDVTGDVTGNVTGNVSGTSGSTTGNAATATALANARTIGGTSFDGTANIVPATAVAVTGSAQSAITSVGTLTGLTMSGAVNMGNQLITNVGASITFSTSVDGVINFPSTGYINFDSDNNSAGEAFVIGSNRTGGSGGDEHFRVEASGNVGIGTPTPQKTVHIEHTGGASEGILISGASDTVGHTAGILLRAEGGEADSALRAKGGIFFERTGTFGVGKLHLANDIGSDNTSAAIADAKLTIDGTSVGINTTSPSSKLHIRDESSNTNTYNNVLRIESQSTGTTTTGFGGAIYWLGERNGDGALQAMCRIRSDAEVNSGTDLSSGLVFETATAGTPSVKVRITHDGTLKVGTVVPTATWDANLDAIQVGEASAFRSGDSDYSAATVMSTNICQISGGDKLLNSTDLAASYVQQGGNHYFYGYNSGTAGNTPAVASNDLANPLVIAKGGGLSISGGSVANTANGKAGIFWHTIADGADYCIRRTNHAWSSSNHYAQLLLDWDTGVKIDVGGGTYGKSYLEVNGNVKFTGSGQGIDYSAVSDSGRTVTSNLLDDYEEGSWTPAIGGGGGSISVALANYIKVGNLVNVYAYVSLTGTRNSNDFVISGLPYNPMTNYYGVGSADFELVAQRGVYCRAQPGGNTVNFYRAQSTTVGRKHVDGNEIGNGYLIFQTQYRVA